MTPAELKAMKKGRFIVLKTGSNPFISKLKLFFKWGIKFDEKNPFTIEDKGAREVSYVSKPQIEAEIIKKFAPPLDSKVAPIKSAEDSSNASGGIDISPRKRNVGNNKLKT